MSTTDEAFIRDVAAKQGFQTEKMCDEKMGTMEGTVKSVNTKLWAIIMLLLMLLGSVAVKSL